MDDYLSQFEWSVVEIVCGVLSISCLFLVCSSIRVIEPITFSTIDQTTTGAHVSYEIPVVEEDDFLVDNAILEKNSYFDWKNYVRIFDHNISLLDYVSVNGFVDTSHSGEYILTFTLNYNGHKIVKQATYYVMEEWA